MSDPLVSILIPCYNAAPWLAETIQSALAQSWSRTEVIVVDDGSTDGSLAIARTFATRGVKVILQANAGASAARNRALQEAGGEFIQFLDADDLISRDKISAQLDALARHDRATTASCAWGRFSSDPAEAVFSDTTVYRDFRPIDFLIHCSTGFHMMHPSAWLVPRSVVQQAGPWNESLTLNDDGEYFCRVLLASAGIAFVAGPQSYYRSGLPGSLSQRRDELSRRSQFRSIELIASHLLAVEDSPRTQRAMANYYQRFIHDFYPAPADLISGAVKRIAALGGSDLAPHMGPKTAIAARLLGWKNVQRLKYWLS